jgi:hypothetical protein
MAKQYIKVRFTSAQHGSTAGLVMALDDYNHKSIEDISRLFPYSEAMKMQTLQRSKAYATWEDAFNHNFDWAKEVPS